MSDTTKTEAYAARLYTTYCKTVGGKAYNGDPLPDWETFRADPSKRVQSDAWMEAAKVERPQSEEPEMAKLPELAKALRGFAESRPVDPDLCELVCCLARLLEGKSVHEAFGAPGNWGYGTPIGDALLASYRR